jgi:hypothetical protein
LALALVATPATAQSGGGHQDAHDTGDDGPRFCPTRPSIGGSSCTTEPGRVQVEASFLDWQRDDRTDSREDRIVAADLLARFGLGARTELQVGWTAFGQDRTRDRTGTGPGAVDSVDSVGDVTLALRQHLAGAEGKPFSLGIQPFVTLPAGREPVGAGTWSAGAIVPVQYELTKTVAVSFTGEADAAANDGGTGRHLAYSGIGTLRYKLTPAVNLYGELEVQRDQDPSGHETHSLAAFSVAWRPTKRIQLDWQAIAGLNRTSPDIRLVTGGAILF